VTSCSCFRFILPFTCFGVVGFNFHLHAIILVIDLSSGESCRALVANLL
jgi:hypothetical protein